MLTAPGASGWPASGSVATAGADQPPPVVATLPDAGEPETPGVLGTGTQAQGDDWQDTVDQHPVANHAVTHSAFDDQDRVNDHPTGP